jgi:hypothetical protein
MKIQLFIICLLISLSINSQTIYTIKTNEPQQEIDNFGASDCWTMYKFGKYATEENINKVADLFFSKELDEVGNPKGIGLSMWRMNFGGGSNDNVFGCYRSIRGRTPCIMKKNGSYDMDLAGTCGGQFNFLKKAKERGCEYTLGFVNSPPYFMTRNGETTGNNNPEYSEKLNLDSAGIEKFTDYLTEVVKKTSETHGVSFDYIDPVNEPEWGANMGENNHANNIDIKKICVSLNQKILNKNLSTKILIPESGTLQFLYSDRGNPAYGMKIENFFGNPLSEAYVGNLSTVAHITAAHAYWSTWLDGPLVDHRTPIPAELKKYNTKYWQTEYCLGEAFDEFVPDAGTVDLSINYGLYIARIIHADLSIGNASAWHWWLGLTDVSYKDGLIFLKRNNTYNVVQQLSSTDNGSVPQSKYIEVYSDAEVVVPKALWCFGNYSRFIRPGATRLKVSSIFGVDNITDIMVSSYQNKDGKLVTVVLNYGKRDKDINLTVSDRNNVMFTPYITSDQPADNLRALTPVSSNSTFTVPARSIITFVEGGVVNKVEETINNDEIKWFVENGFIIIKNAKDCNVSVYNAIGRLTFKKKSISNDEIIKPSSGFNIVCIEKDGKVLERFKMILPNAFQ